MKLIVINVAAIVCMVFSAPSFADRGDAVNTFTGTGDTRTAACTDAKQRAQRAQNPLAQIRSFSLCDCSQGSANSWTCSVDATFYRP